jgi:spore maturation protein CgeB
MMLHMKILFVGPLSQGSTTLQRLNAFVNLGYEVNGINSESYFSGFKAFIFRVLCHFRIHLDWIGLNKEILTKVNYSNYDFVWIEKGLNVKKSTIQNIKSINSNIIIISYSCDDMMVKFNQSFYYLKSIPYYHYHITTKSYNVEELKKIGAFKVYFFSNAYDSIAYNSSSLSEIDKEKWGADVSFLGGFEYDRFEKMLFLAKSGIKIKIWGPGWEEKVNIHPNLEINPGWVMDTDAAKVFKSSKINLHFLRKIARDLQTTRSMEIPACKSFMLAERTIEHSNLFVEGEEAEFFDTNEELLYKVNFFLENNIERNTISEKGYLRCNLSGYDYSSRLLEILKFVQSDK